MSAETPVTRFAVIEQGQTEAEAVRLKTLELGRLVSREGLMSHPLFLSSLLQLAVSTAIAHRIPLRELVAVLQAYEKQVGQ